MWSEYTKAWFEAAQILEDEANAYLDAGDDEIAAVIRDLAVKLRNRAQPQKVNHGS